MIKCSNCGIMNPDTMINCKHCMAPLPAFTGKSESGFGPQASSQGAPVLPAWLESLRAGDHPAAPPKNFSREDMVDEGKIPSWMQANRPPQDERISNQHPSLRSSAFPSPNTDEGNIAGRNISANSLVDPNSLPSWMKPEEPQAPQQSISGASLVQPEFMPDWMKTMQPSTQQPAPFTPPTQQQQAPMQQPLSQPQQPMQGFSAQQLIDQQSLPNWMRQDGGQSFAPPAQSAPLMQPTQPPYNGQAGNGSTGQSGFAASSLLDMNAMPSWMRDAERGGQAQGQDPRNQPQQAAWQQQAPQQPPQRGYEQSWQTQQQPPQQQAWQQPVTNNTPASGQGGTLSMGSLIDMNTLPEWLRSGVESQQGTPTGQQDSQQRYDGFNAANSYGTQPPRVDNMRVPSRPRGEVGTNEGSEVAANVFASMLGVASNAPQYPPQQPGYPTPPTGQPMGNAPQYPNQPLGVPDAQKYTMGQPGQQSYSQGAPMQYPTTTQAGQGNYPGGISSMLPPQNQGQGAANMGQAAQENTQKPAKKGGIFEAIRSFFFR